MSIGSRIKELRIKNEITQEELAKIIGVTKGAIANYENGVSSPKIDLMYKLFDALNCDANYLYQDDMRELYKDKATPEEFDNIIKKYRDLDDHGREMVDFTLTKEYERSTASSEQGKESDDNIIEMSSHLNANAAHVRTDIDIPEGKDASDNDIMDDDDF